MNNIIRKLSYALGYLAITLFLMTGCQSSATKVDESINPVLEFFDSKIFDNQLSTALSSNQTNITTDFVSEANVNQIPERIDKWLYYIQSNNGEVEFTADPSAQKSLATELVGIVVGTYLYIKKNIMYSPAKNYHAKVYYDPATGVISQIVFTKRTG